MAKVIWTQRSLTDLISIAEFISKDSIKYASLTLQRIIGAARYLENNPKIGRRVPEVGKSHNIREIILGNYRIIYKISNSRTVHSLTVHHSARKLRQTSLRKEK
jgi:addiction module RelE/StbE family toxin